MPYPSCRSSHPRCEPRPFPPGGVRRRTDRSHPAWGRSDATHTGGVLLAPLPGECKCRLAGTHSPVFPAPNRPDFGHAHRPLSARYPAEHRNRPAAVRVLRDRGAHHRAGRISDLRPRLPPRRHGLSRCRDDRAARLVAGFRGLAGGRTPSPGAVHDRRGDRPISITASRRPTCCCSAANPRACRQRSTTPPMPASSFRCAPACARSMSRSPPPWPPARRCGRSDRHRADGGPANRP